MNDVNIFLHPIRAKNRPEPGEQSVKLKQKTMVIRDMEITNYG